ncbi:hypothetical protein DICPUDRAFT_80312 [Dictyostelium purpureum]|uniref:Uncharacterized protein n=1 Tax=Dictyostelium purpureum TaxID=5786 RepID=F0ZQ46_DICPU|nr:uncharacterized protein DICPUDRAFT_80312 [Dictyostelium purpureum]EGC33946.1 hypothetical protein DICPUDRAFT_80312 [Dictyostelium purpureum]|eukprot:XP_003289528.1 hypothetical protein DICPUDRAFT_80312 [Dictyostelium purpureum]
MYMNNNNNIIKNNESKDRSETLFWSVFRNKWLFSKIFSNFTLKDSYTYDQLIYAPSLFNYYSNAVEIVQDKIKSNGYLVFDTIYSHGLLEMAPSIRKDTKENVELLESFFKNRPSISSNVDNSILFAIHHSNLFLFKFIVNYFQLSKKEITTSTSKITSFHFDIEKNISDVKAFKILKYLRENDYFPKIDVDFRYFNIYDKKIKLKYIMKFIELLTEFKGTKDKKSKLETIKAIYEFSEDELKQSIKQLLKSHFSNPNYRLMDAIRHYSILFFEYFNDIEIPAEHHFIFETDENKIVQLFIKRPYHIVHFKKLYKFRYNNDTTKIKKFISNASRSDIRADFFYTSVLITGNMELITYLHSLSSIGLVICGVFPMVYYVSNSLDSPEVANFYYSKFKDYLIYKNLNRCWLYFTNLGALEAVEKNMVTLERKFLVGNFTNQDPLVKKNTLQLDILIRALNNPNVYQVEKGLDINTYNDVIVEYISQKKLDTVIQLFTTFKFKEITFTKLFDGNNQRKLKHLTKWIFDHCHETPTIEVNNAKIVTTFENGNSITFVIPVTHLILSLACIGHYNFLFQIIKSNTTHLLTLVNNMKPESIDAYFEVSFIPITALIECFKYSIDHLKPDSNIKDYCHKLMYIAANESHLPLFTLINSNYSFLLNNKEPTSEDKLCFEKSKLKEILDCAHKSKDQTIYNLLKNYIHIEPEKGIFSLFYKKK